MRKTSLIAFPMAVSFVIVAPAADVLRAQDRYPVRQLTVDPAQEGFPSWSPDGATIVHSYVTRTDGGLIAGLWTVSAAGGAARRLTDEIGEHPDWSPDGRYIVFDGDSGNSVKVVASTGGHPIRLVPASIRIFRGGQPVWSPDGTQIAFDSDSALWVLDIRTGAARSLFRRPGKLAIVGCWSPDGMIYLTLWDANGPASAIWAVPVSGAEPRLIAESDRRYRYPDISPAGTLLAFAWCEGRNCDLWVMPAAGGTPLQLTTHPALDESPRWSPDGTRIAFTSTRSGSFDIWVMTVDLDRLRHDLQGATEGRAEPP
jgi:Tol biopolymer transport system component